MRSLEDLDYCMLPAKRPSRDDHTPVAGLLVPWASILASADLARDPLQVAGSLRLGCYFADRALADRALADRGSMDQGVHWNRWAPVDLPEIGLPHRRSSND